MFCSSADKRYMNLSKMFPLCNALIVVSGSRLKIHGMVLFRFINGGNSYSIGSCIWRAIWICG